MPEPRGLKSFLKKGETMAKVVTLAVGGVMMAEGATPGAAMGAEPTEQHERAEEREAHQVFGQLEKVYKDCCAAELGIPHWKGNHMINEDGVRLDKVLSTLQLFQDNADLMESLPLNEQIEYKLRCAHLMKLSVQIKYRFAENGGAINMVTDRILAVSADVHQTEIVTLKSALQLLDEARSQENDWYLHSNKNINEQRDFNYKEKNLREDLMLTMNRIIACLPETIEAKKRLKSEVDTTLGITTDIGGRMEEIKTAFTAHVGNEAFTIYVRYDATDEKMHYNLERFETNEHDHIDALRAALAEKGLVHDIDGIVRE